jgi:predicted glycosyltransferase
MLFTPKIIPLSAWRKYGIDGSRIVRYDALDPVAWLRDLKPNPRILDELGLDRFKPIVTVRPEESQAAYLINKGFQKSLSISLCHVLLREVPDVQVVMIPRYDPSTLPRKRLNASFVIPCSAVDATSLLHYSNLFLGGGGTMTAEAALLGVPSISFYPGPATYVDRYLMGLGLITRTRSVGAIVRYAIRILRNPSYAKALKVRSRKVISRMEDPIKVVERHLK